MVGGVTSPIWPKAFEPQAQTVPSGLSARLWPKPAARALTPLRFDTCTGVRLPVFVPLPRARGHYPPQARTVPSCMRARLKLHPAAMHVTPFRFCTCTGVLRWTVVPSPNWPQKLLPQAHSVPSLLSARLCSRRQPGAYGDHPA